MKRSKKPPTPLSDEQKAELDRRLNAYHQNPDEGASWELVRERIKRRT